MNRGTAMTSCMQGTTIRWVASLVVAAGVMFAGAGVADAGVSAEAEAAEQAALKLWDAGKREEALAELDKALAAEPRWKDALLLRAGFRAKLGGEAGAPAPRSVTLLSGALEDLKKALKRKPAKGERKSLMATLKYLRKQLGAAKKRQRAEGGGAASAQGTCAQGMVKGPGTAGHCCWPEQEWSSHKEQCIGTPECPSGMTVQGAQCTAGAGPTPAPDEPPSTKPSLDESWEWLLSKAGRLTYKFKNDDRDSVEELSREGACTLVVKRPLVSANGSLTTTFIDHVPLEEINGAQIRAQPDTYRGPDIVDVALETQGRRRVIRSEREGSNGEISREKLDGLGVTLFFVDQPLAERVAKALRHMVELCAAKKKAEPF